MATIVRLTWFFGPVYPNPAELAVATMALEGEAVGFDDVDVPDVDVLLSDLDTLIRYLLTYAMSLDHLRKQRAG